MNAQSGVSRMDRVCVARNTSFLPEEAGDGIRESSESFEVSELIADRPPNLKMWYPLVSNPITISRGFLEFCYNDDLTWTPKGWCMALNTQQLWIEMQCWIMHCCLGTTYSITNVLFKLVFLKYRIKPWIFFVQVYNWTHRDWIT